MKNMVLTYKIGAVEVLIAEIPIVAIFGEAFWLLALLTALALFAYTKHKYKGEFSLADICSLVKEEVDDLDNKTK